MPKDLTWDDAEDVGILLSEKHPNTDPLTVRYTDLHRYVTELADFKDDPKKSSESKLEAIQMAWHEEYEERGLIPHARQMGEWLQHRLHERSHLGNGLGDSSETCRRECACRQ